MTTLWKLLSAFALPLIAPLIAAHSLLTGKKRRGLAHHLGIVPKTPAIEPHQKTLWLFALSVGEVGSAVPVLKLIRERRPDIRIAVSVTTDAGYDAAVKQLPFADAVFFNPIDLWPLPQIACSRIRPDLFVVTETGLWPGQLSTMKARGIPCLLFQGRISEKTMRRYRLAPSATKMLFDHFDWMGMMHEDGVAKVRSLEIAEGKIERLGNTKFDGVKTLAPEEAALIRHQLSLAEGVPVWVAGSTHEGEEEIILNAFSRLKPKHPTLTLILAPRRMERIGSIESLLRSLAMEYMKRSEITPGRGRSGSVILLDTVGELARIYSIAKVAFVGNSLLPPGGGHSLLEPAAQGVAVLHGPRMEYHQDVADSLHKEEIAFRVSGAEELCAGVDRILSSRDLREKISGQGPRWIRQMQGASERMAAKILEWI